MLVVQDYDVRPVDVDRRWYLDVQTHLHESEDWFVHFGAVFHDGFAVCLPLLLLLSDCIQPRGSGGIGTATTLTNVNICSITRKFLTTHL